MGEPVTCKCGERELGSLAAYRAPSGVVHTDRGCATDSALLTTQEATAAANAKGEGFKADGEKARFDLIPWEAVEDIASHGSLLATRAVPGQEGNRRRLGARARQDEVAAARLPHQLVAVVHDDDDSAGG